MSTGDTINLKLDFVISGPLIAVEIPLMHKRAVKRGEIITFFSCNPLAELELRLAS